MDGRRPPITPPGHRDLKICSGTGGADGIGGTVGTGGIGGKSGTGCTGFTDGTGSFQKHCLIDIPFLYSIINNRSSYVFGTFRYLTIIMQLRPFIRLLFVYVHKHLCKYVKLITLITFRKTRTLERMHAVDVGNTII